MAILQNKQLDLKPVFQKLISTLLLSDSCCILFSNLIFSLPKLSPNFELYIFPHILPFFLPLTQISLTISITTTVLVSLERFLSICCPQYQISPFKWLKLAGTIFIFAVAIDICK